MRQIPRSRLTLYFRREPNTSHVILTKEKAHLKRFLERYQKVYIRYLILNGMIPDVIGREIRSGGPQRMLKFL